MPDIENYCVAIEPIAFFRSSEEVNLHLTQQLIEKIIENENWLAPIVVEKDSGIVMDGNHRLQAAFQLGLKFLPCIPLRYHDPRVAVLHWETGAAFPIEDIHRTIMNNRLFPYKTTRHVFTPSLPITRIPLTLLMK